MADRENVIRGLIACKNHWCAECPYTMHGFKCYGRDHMFDDAITLLKEQEAKMVVQTTSTIRCPGCGKQITSKGAIHKEIKYCWKCGQAVKWE